MQFINWRCSLLAAIFCICNIPCLADPPPPTEWTPVSWADASLERGNSIHKTLDNPLNSLGIEVTDAPLSEVAAFLTTEYDIPVQLDHQALEDLGVSPDDPITCQLQNMTLRSALKLMLRQLDLTAVVSDEVLLITSEEEASTRLVVAVYPVGDILTAKTAGPPDESPIAAKPNEMNTLIDVIISAIAPDTWVENGGPEAEIRAIQPGLLVVSQTYDVHRQLSDLLKAIRVAREHPCAVSHLLGSVGGTFCGEHHPTNQPAPANQQPADAPPPQINEQDSEPGEAPHDVSGGGES